MPDSEDFYRVKRLPPYVFAEVNRLKAEYRAEGRDIVDFGMGNPDMDAPAHIVEKLVETVREPRVHRYSASRGIAGLRRAQAAYYARRFGVGLDPESEVIATLGSKEGLANLAMAITAPGDVILAPNPSYPIHPYGFVIAGGTLRHIPAPPATIFAWAPVPEPFRSLGSMEFAKLLLDEAEVAPGIGFGEYGEGYVCIALVENEHRIRRAARNVRRLMQNADAILGRYTQLRETSP